MVSDDLQEEAGIFTWPLAGNMIYGDTAVAYLFGLDPTRTVKGLTARHYLKGVYTNDRDVVARLWFLAIRSRNSFHVEFRVKDAQGVYRRVASSGRCFGDAIDHQAHFVGIVYPISMLSLV
ncbi:PAS domain-containing protein [Rhizobium sp. P38BS-XIX]|uniref:PAS domain-containing protein n=1 Tax=Rhizobium sp. P38BS-XIX TaxID=2726740 RepID=UPI0014574F37|nr:PAS domain-containing protein [Rhizobium sp. P38BS-XIX]NLR97246.1 PAS domain-containing protein [Rhizobium sp. P38BS-XIX]